MVRRLFEDSEPGARPIGAGSATLEAGEAPAPGGPPMLAPTTVRLGTPRRRPRELRWLGDLAALVFLCALAVALTWPLARHPASTLPDLGDPLDSAWRLAWPAHQLLRNPAHLFDANIFYPVKTSYLFDELILGVALLVAPVTLATGNGVLAFNVAILLAAAGNGLGMYFLARRLSGSRWAALAAALVYAAAPFRLWHIGHVGLSTAVWMPLALLFLDRCLHAPSWRDALAFGACVAMQSLSAQYYGFQVAIVAGLYLLYALARRREAVLAPPFVGRLIAATVFAEALLFPVVAPYVAVKGTWGYTRGLEENELYSATLSSFLAAPSDYLLGGPLSAKLRGALRVHDWALWLYPGLGAVALAALGAFRPRPARRVSSRTVSWAVEAIGARAAPIERRVRGKSAPPVERLDLYPFMIGLALFGAVMTLGPVLYPQAIGLHAVTRWMPYRLFFNTVPVFDAMRAPERFGNVILLGLGGAVSYGVAAVLAALRGLSRRARAVAVPLVAVALLVVTGAEYVRAPLHPRAVPPAPPVYAWLAKQPVGPAIELPLGSPPSELNREQVRQYWSTTHWQPRLNGSSDLQPYAFTALR
ncbi:MAG TPA: hypothetical protein VF310_02960, partial [Vicinamibacteria bacterium]